MIKQSERISYTCIGSAPKLGQILDSHPITWRFLKMREEEGDKTKAE
jgi:hypothetical protein